MVQLNVVFNAVQLQEGLSGIPLWLILLIFLLVVIVGVIWFLNQEQKEEGKSADSESDESADVEVVGVEGEHLVPEEIEPDDLTLIEGIGPKLSTVLHQAGILTWAKLAQTEVSELQRILDEAGISKISNPTTWPEQASLAAAGDWDGLEELQDELKGGRRSVD